jgi:hypothetical protein
MDSQSNLVQLQVFETIEAQMDKNEFSDLVERNFEYLIGQLSKANSSALIDRYFDFLTAFVNKFYSNFTFANT